ncbi:hypothetical protein S7711_00034 [Stachybotrys chartarum IBT 7711]|uniref:Uncharacterized protein n=1 Tax=Stachybotrys chartarum (strain CBS 109288 / IBT 7711) TaxID=1280523 RepID=A0A084B386_STACB|nr:hypothetical protein S7711_00034 [Stachybotrys chartarum IBT 7711]KFA45939.1 hypothetical protein S40293_07307 [Stachybotrys chartarum IBT 40293]
MEDIYRNLGVINFWGDHESLNETSFQVTQYWLRPSDGAIIPEDGKVVSTDRIDEWLQGTVRHGPKGREILIARYAFVEISVQERRKLSKSAGQVVEKKKVTNIPDSAIKEIVKKLGLKLAHDYAKSWITGVTALPPVSDQHATRQAFAVSYAPKFLALWSQSRFKPPSVHETITSGMFFAEASDGTKKMGQSGNGSRIEKPGYLRVLKQIMQAPWHREIHMHTMFPVFLTAACFSMQVAGTQEGIKKELREVESQTGYHNFDREHKPSLDWEDLGELSRKSNGHATLLANLARKSKTTETLLSFAFKTMNKDRQPKRRQKNGGAPVPTVNGNDLLRNHLSVLQDRLAMQDLDIAYTLRRVQVQIDALFHLVTETDSLANLQLSKSTKDLAFFSYRDASSMKTLAVVTMLFLPGSFVSALFSTNCFEWDNVDLRSSSIGVNVTPQFGLYWVVTIPLTLLTFVAYFIWLWVQKRERERSFAELEKRQAAEAEALETQAKRLSSQRRLTMLPKDSTMSFLA